MNKLSSHWIKTVDKYLDQDECVATMDCAVEEMETQPGSDALRNTPPGAAGRAVRGPSLPDIGGLNLKNGQQEDEDITTIRKWIEEEKIPVEDMPQSLIV